MRSLGLGQIALLVVLTVLLLLTGFWATSVWHSTGDAVMDRHGWIALGLGTFFSLLIGAGCLDVLSSRSGHDDAADPFRKRREPPVAQSSSWKLLLINDSPWPLAGVPSPGVMSRRFGPVR